MLVVDTPQDLKKHIGAKLGPSQWITVDQAMIDGFAETTGDHQWIHVDVARAERELPTRSTIAHGFLVLSLLPRMIPELYRITKLGPSLNYGSDRVRFTAPVPAGSRVRLRATLVAADDAKDGAVRITNEYVIEIDGRDRPAVVAEVISLAYP